MKMWWLACCAAALFGCGSGEPRAKAAELSAESRPSAQARWVEAQKPGDRSLLEAPARAVATSAAVARVAPPFAARLVRLRVAPGDEVRAGDVLADVVMPTVLDAAAAYVATSERRAMREARRSELENLRREGLVDSAQVFEQDANVAELDGERARALAVLRAAGVVPQAAAALLASGTSRLTSPIDGVVSEVSARLGEVREPSGAPLFEIVGKGPARIEARLARELPAGATLAFVAISGEHIELRSEPAASLVDPADGTQRVWLVPREEHALADGLRGTLHVRLEGPGIVELPARALGRDERGAYVLRRTDPGHERVAVEVLASGGGSVIARGALAPGEPIASDVAALSSGDDG